MLRCRYAECVPTTHLRPHYAPRFGAGKRGVSALEFQRAKLSSAEKRVEEPQMDYRKYITYETGKRGGKPCIRGLRIAVYDVLDYLASGMTPEQIVADFDYLTLEDIRACLAYAADRERQQLVLAA